MDELVWRKSTRSDAEKACVEIADLNGTIGIRDSKHPDGGFLALTPGQWRGLLNGIRAGACDL